MINGIGSSYSFFNYQTTINQIKLQQALSKNPDYDSYRGYVDSMQSQTNTINQSRKNSSLSFVQSYSKTMSSVMQSANSLRSGNSAGIANALSANSSNSNVADVTKNFTLRQKSNISLNISQLATSQKNSSYGVKGTEIAKGNMSFSISNQKGNFLFDIQAIGKNGIAKANDDMLHEAANAINTSNSGIKATVGKNDNGDSVLSLESEDTGVNAAFSVDGDMGAAEGVQAATQNAANARYSITENGTTQEYTSQSNTVQLDYGRMQANLKATGTTTISVGMDTEQIISAVSNLVDSYNQATDFLRNNADRGSGISRQLHNFERSIASEDTMKRLGISADKNGRLTLNEEALRSSFAKDPSLTEELISGKNGLADTLFNKASSAMSVNSSSLINNDLSAIDNSIGNYTRNSNMGPDAFQFMSTYSRAGSFNLNNYAAVGIMMNYLV